MRDAGCAVALRASSSASYGGHDGGQVRDLYAEALAKEYARKRKL